MIRVHNLAEHDFKKVKDPKDDRTCSNENCDEGTHLSTRKIIYRSSALLRGRVQFRTTMKGYVLVAASPTKVVRVNLLAQPCQCTLRV